MNPPNEPRADEASPVFDSALILASVAVAGLAFVYFLRHQELPDIDGDRLRALREPFLPEVRGFVKPEPNERLFYVAGLLYAAVVPISIYAVLRRLLSSRWLERSRRQLSSSTSAGVQGTLLLAGFATWVILISRESELPWALGRWTDAAAMAALVAVASRVSIPRWRKARYLVLAPFAWLAFKMILCTEPLLLAERQNSHHIDLLIGAINQVAHGRTILVDTSSQYGLAYPYIIAALIRPFGITLTSIAVAFTLLGLASLGFLYAVVRRAARAVEDTAAAELVFLGVAGLTISYFLASVFGLQWIYYQYFPLRIVWGSFFFWYVGTYVRATGERRERLGLWGYFLSGLAFLWNADTGLVVAVAWAATAAFDAVARGRPTWARGALVAALHVVALAATLAGSLGLYCVFAWVRSRHWPHLGELARFQRTFYGSGFLMLPMKPWDAWHTILAVPAVTLFLCLRRWITRTADEHTSEKLFIALFGLGIFSFFQGRSHVHVMLPVAYPSVLLGGLHFLDYARSDAPRVSLGFDRIVKALCLLAPGWGLVNVSHAAPKLWADFVVREEQPPDPRLMAQLDALRQRHKGRELPIISEMANYLHVKTGTWSPFPVSALTECMTLEQADEVNAAVRAKNLTQFLQHASGPPVANHIKGERLTLDQWLQAH